MKVTFKVCCSEKNVLQSGKKEDENDGKSDCFLFPLLSTHRACRFVDSKTSRDGNISPLLTSNISKEAKSPEKPSIILNKLLNNISNSDYLPPSSIALPVWLDDHRKFETSKDDSNHGPSSSVNRDSSKINSHSSTGLSGNSQASGDGRSVTSGSHHHYKSSSPYDSSSTPSSPIQQPTSSTSYWWRPHFTKLSSLKHNNNLTNNNKNVDSSLANDKDNNNYSRTIILWVIVVAAGLALTCLIICALFACSNYLFFPPRRRKQHSPKY